MNRLKSSTVENIKYISANILLELVVFLFGLACGIYLCVISCETFKP